MSFRLVVKAMGLPKLNNGHYASWRTAAAERKKWRRAIYLLSFTKKPHHPLSRCKITCTRFAYGKKPDFDNLVISFKSCIDGLKDAGVILDDGPDVILERVYKSDKAPAKKGWIEIEVEEL